jgi:serine/threonine protein kinase
MSEQPHSNQGAWSPSVAEHLDKVCDRFEAAWRAARSTGRRPRIEDWLADTPEAERPALVHELIALEIAYRRRAGEQPQAEEYRDRFPFVELAQLGNLLRAQPTSSACLSSLERAPWSAFQSTSEPANPPRSLLESVNLHGPFPQDFGRYRLLSLLGRGGMGTVYLAEDTRLQIRVALKLPFPDLLADPRALKQFYREARAAARLCHPGLCQVFDVGRLGDTHYLAMRYIEGAPLAPRPLRDTRGVALLVRKLAEAMTEAHRLAVVHRDLKPANILLTPQGEPVITDFGLALRLDTADVWTASPTAGTWSYMAPEQVQGDPDTLGPGCDIYGLGVILYELLTGRVPFRATDREELCRQILGSSPVQPSQVQPGVDPRLEMICLKALSKPIASRWPSMHEFAAALAEYLGSATPMAETPRPLIRREVIHFQFAGLGEHASIFTSPRDRLFLDVGNDLRPGMLDHHHLTAHAGSTASLVLAHPALLDGAVRKERSPEASFVIVLHANPDLDCIVSTYLAVAYLMTRAFPDGAYALARYADEVAEGRRGMSLANPFALYAAYICLTHRLLQQQWNSEVEYWQECVRSGLELVTYVVREVILRGVPLPTVDAFACPGLFSPEDRQQVQDDIQRYRGKLENPGAMHARPDCSFSASSAVPSRRKLCSYGMWQMWMTPTAVLISRTGLGPMLSDAQTGRASWPCRCSSRKARGRAAAVSCR